MRKSTNAILKISAILENVLWQFFWYILGFCTTRLFFENLKKVEFRVGRTLLKKDDFFSKMTSSLKNLPFWIFEKVFSTKVR
jgi:prolipoprotein diacylglyceryltransferase